MIDIEKVKEIPDDKPRKGPHRMSKSEKCEARGRYKADLRRRRMSEHLRLVEEARRFREAIIRGLGVPPEFIDPLDPSINTIRPMYRWV